LKIDFVSDVSCPWCAVGLYSLQGALARLDGKVAADIHVQPFELNPDMAMGGEDIDEHLHKKYGSSAQQLERNREVLRQRGAEVGFEFRRRERVYNTFDAHRLLHWASLEGRGVDLKQALLRAYFSDGRDVGDHETLVDVAASAGLPADRAREILASREFADEVRAHERFYIERGINGVPAVIVNEQYLISGGQPVDVFESALKRIAGLR
jgi:predicted DsbA family dithiol-disulfide isomerase